MYLRKKDYETAYLRISDYISTDSSNTEAFYIASFATLKLKRYAQSLSFIERCLLRNPTNEDYLKLHSKIKEKLASITKTERRFGA